ncbi:D-alanyl-D-alanine carboxypeptidase [Streptomyces wuyuanensis]|uniref:D-alanyl-D-alanine carboxypeptidase n=1 Tax=Streptomyces wuyuanensis TaxID=1196353 RepID=UPI003430D0F5
MAGESPDKSEQQKSSGETTPGERDPRLAVARSAGASTEGRVDQPTAVFRTLPSEPSEPSEPASSGTGTGADSGGATDASADADPDRGTDADADTGGDAADSASGSEDEAGSSSPESGVPETGAPETGASEAGAPEGRSSEDPSSGSGERASDGDDRLRAAVAAWVSGKDKTTGGTAGESVKAAAATDEGTGEGEGGSKDSAEAPAPVAEDEAAGKGSGGDEADAEAPVAVEGDDAPEDAPSAPEAADKAGKRPTPPAPRKSDDAEPSAGAKANADVKADAGESDGGESGEGGDEGGAGSRTPSWAAARSAVKESTAAEGSSGDRPGAADGDRAVVAGSDRDADETDGAEDRTPVDQPTAVFKALPRPAVDQPTTALKITSQPAPPKQATKSSASSAQSDSEHKDSDRSDSEHKDSDRSGSEHKGSDRSGSEHKGSERTGSEKEAERTTALRVTAPPSERAKPGTEPGGKPAAGSDGKPGSPGTPGARTTSAAEGASGSAPAAPRSGRPAPDGASGDAPEPAAERTSTFVPLRRDDVRPAASSAQPAPATAKPAGPAASAAAPPASLTEPERTKQQPLPPKPPLDLLAELTNTPPPPQTPVRTLVRRVRIWTPLVVLLLIVFAVAQYLRPLPAPTLTLTAEPTYAFEGSAPQLPWPAKGQAYMAASGLGTLGSSGEQKPVPIASVTKSMTAYVILKNHPLKPGEAGPMIEIDAKGESDGQLDKTDNESTLNTVKKGDKISLRDALAAIMIPSANNIARQLARWDSGSEKAFVEKMNAAADELGMTNTTYTDPSGLDATTVSTAEDQVKLGLKLVEIKALMDITKLPEWTDPSGKKWRNYNELPPYNGALGIKTGSTTKAGGNLLFAAHKMVGDTDQLIVGAVLAQHDTPILGTAIKASKDLMLATQDALKNATIVKKGQVVGVVEDGLGGSVPVVATKDVQAVGWSGLTVKLELTNGGKALPHEAAAGSVVGSLTVGEGASQVTVPVTLQDDLVEPGFGAKLTRLG